MWADSEESTHLGKTFQAKGTSAKTLDECVYLEEYLCEGQRGYSEASEKRSETWDNGGWIGYCLNGLFKQTLVGLFC